MGWHHLYEIDAESVDVARISEAAGKVAEGLGARLEVQADEDGDMELYFVVPMHALRARESGAFDFDLIREHLEGAASLTVHALFRQHPRRPEVLLVVRADEVANDMCDRTAAHIATELCALLGGRLRTRH